MPLLLSITCCAFSAIGSFLFGYDTGIIASVIEQPDFNRRFGNGNLSSGLIGGIVSSFTGGAILGTLAVSLISDRFGRRAAIFIGAVLASVGGSLQGGANNVATVIVGRLIAGAGIGLLSPTIPNFCMEIAPHNIRGMLGGLQQWMLGLGIVVAQWVGYGCSLTGSSFSWRFPLAIQVAPALLLACGIYLWPESPRWLVEKGQMSKARLALERLHLHANRSNQGYIDSELEEIQLTFRAERACIRPRWVQLFQEKDLLRRILLACGIQLFTQTSGVNVIGYFGPRIYSSLGFTTNRALFIQGLYGALAQLWNTVCILVVDRIGRRKLLIPSLVGMGAALCVEATLVRYYPPSGRTNSAALRASVAMNFVFSIFFTSLGVISWIYSGEIFPMAYRARGTSLSTFTNWAANLVFAQCSPLALSKMGPQYFYIFMALNWIAAGIVYFLYPETQNEKTLEAASHKVGDLETDKFRTPHEEKPLSHNKTIPKEAPRIRSI